MTNIYTSDIENGVGGFVIFGADSRDDAGCSVSIVGDINGDGLMDVVIGARFDNVPGKIFSGRSYVVFGQTGTTSVDLSDVINGVGGFVINGEYAYDYSGVCVSAAGDMNSDGLADLIVGCPFNDSVSPYAGRSYVIYGKTSTAAIDLTTISSGSSAGFIVDGFGEVGLSGFCVSSAGDVNGDGFSDLIIGAPYRYDRISAYVVFGKSVNTNTSLANAANGIGGFRITGTGNKDRLGDSLAGAGDVNGDGLADLIVSAYKYNSFAGQIYVVFGKTNTTTVDLNNVVNGVGGFAINSEERGSHAGHRVAAAGDVNGDGLADLLLSAHLKDSATTTNVGRTYVVFGKTNGDTVNLTSISNGSGGGFSINGQTTNDQSGFSVSSAGDVNGDGLADILVGTYQIFSQVANNSFGRAYLVYGKTSSTAVELSAVDAGIGGFVIKSSSFTALGISVSGAGDINGDGLGDLLIGAPSANGTNRYDGTGNVYVIFGSTTGAFASSFVDQMGGSGNDTLTGTSAAETLVGGMGNDTLIGNGGADVLYGGAGDDVFVLTPNNLNRLSAGITSGQYARIDGGTGIDKITFSGTGNNFDLTYVANQGGGAPGSTSRIESIEIIDITGTGKNGLSLSAKDVVDMAGMNSFNNANGWVDGAFNLAAGGTSPERRHQLIIEGNSGDTLALSDNSNWIRVGTVSKNGVTYKVFNNQVSAAQLIVNLNVNTAPMMQAVAPINYTDTAFDDTFADFNGTLLGYDVDIQALTYGIAGGTDNGDGTVSLAFAYGELTVNKSSGAYTLVVDDSAVEALTGTTSSALTVTASDGQFVYNRPFTVNFTQSGVTESLDDDTLTGTSAADVFNGLAGDDVIDGLAGADTMAGGTGNDTYIVDNTGDIVIETSTLSTEIDTVNSSVTYTLSTNAENINLLGVASINATGNALANVMVGNSGNNTLLAGGGADILSGGAGNDVLIGSAGNDTLTGGSGADLFRFNTSLTNNIDTITDFNAVDDVIELKNTIFTQLTSLGTLSASHFVVGPAALDSNDYLIYNSSTGALSYDADGNGANAMVQIALLSTGLAMTYTDFIVAA
ncbi:hypothetical protein JCM14076_20020 [Methylosoma difficile]